MKKVAPGPRNLAQLVEELVEGDRLGRPDPTCAADCEELAHAGLDALPALSFALRKDLPILSLERIEFLLKRVLGNLLARSVDGPTARSLARFQRGLGFLMKYKPYGVKAASPLGFSRFLLFPGQGFSFQRHVTHKIEAFHILQTLPGGFVFLCEYEEWERCYEPAAFASWLAGAADARLERHRVTPKPGDVFLIDRLGLVHTAIGCLLEEFATVSTDMVDRLHDQNAGLRIPPQLDREAAERGLLQGGVPESNHLISPSPMSRDGFANVPLAPEAIGGGVRTVLADTDFLASRVDIAPHGQTDSDRDATRAISVYVAQGRGRLLLADSSEAAGRSLWDRVEPIEMGKGDLLMIAPGTHFRYANDEDSRLRLSEHRVAVDAAFLES